MFRPDGFQLRLTDASTGAPLLRKEEESEARRQAEERVRALEEELERLRRPPSS